MPGKTKRKDGTPLRKWGYMGRPPKEINKEEFERSMHISHTLLEMCSIFECDDVTLNAWCKNNYGVTYSDLLPRFAAKGKTSLRRKVWQLALERDDWRAIEKLADKHLDMNTDRPNLILGAQNAQDIKIVWQTIEHKKKPEDFFD